MTYSIDHKEQEISSEGFENIASQISGITSATSSIFIVSIILRSKRMLSSPYHLIICGLSFWDILTSITITTSSLMTIDEVDPHAELIYEGNISVCKAKGYIIAFGTFFTISSNICLNVFFMCTFRYWASGQTMKKRILPIMFALSCSLSTALTFSLKQVGFLEVRTGKRYCSVGNNESISDDNIGARLIFGLSLFLAFCSTLMVTVMALQKRSLRSAETQQVRAYSERSGDDGDEDADREAQQYIADERSNHNIAILQRICLMYIAAFVFTWVWPVIFILLTNTSILGQWFNVARSICQPSQGFFNVLIFVHHKISKLRQSHQDYRFLRALKVVFVSPSTVPLDDVLVPTIETGLESSMVGEGRRRRDVNSSFSFDLASIDTPSFDLSDALSSTGNEDLFNDENESFEKNQQDGDNTSNSRTIRRLFYIDWNAPIDDWMASSVPHKDEGSSKEDEEHQTDDSMRLDKRFGGDLGSHQSAVSSLLSMISEEGSH